MSPPQAFLSLPCLVLALGLTGPRARAAEPSGRTAACACCAETLPASPALSGRSVYQIDAALTDDAGRSFRLASLLGRPVVVAMFFTHCAYACPLTVSDMRRIREALPPAVRAQTHFVLVSFDSERDTAETLRAYRARNELGGDWILARGPPEDVRELAMVLGVKYSRDSRGQFAHSNVITVLNSGGEIAFQRVGLQGEIAGAVRAVALAAR